MHDSVAYINLHLLVCHFFFVFLSGCVSIRLFALSLFLPVCLPVYLSHLICLYGECRPKEWPKAWTDLDDCRTRRCLATSDWGVDGTAWLCGSLSCSTIPTGRDSLFPVQNTPTAEAKDHSLFLVQDTPDAEAVHLSFFFLLGTNVSPSVRQSMHKRVQWPLTGLSVGNGVDGVALFRGSVGGKLSVCLPCLCLSISLPVDLPALLYACPCPPACLSAAFLSIYIQHATTKHHPH